MFNGKSRLHKYSLYVTIVFVFICWIIVYENNRNHNGTNNFPLGIVAVFMSILDILVYFDFSYCSF